MCFWWTIGYAIIRLRRRFGYNRQHDERSSELPVAGIPIPSNLVADQVEPARPQLNYSNVNTTERSDGRNDNNSSRV
jgi:hypothetical protein